MSTTVRFLGAFSMAFLLASCGGDDGKDLGDADAADPGGDLGVADTAVPDAPTDAADVPGADADAAVPDAPPGDVPPDAPGDLPGDVAGDPGPDVPANLCCMYDYTCPSGWECVAIPDAMGACKPFPGPDMCWSGHDCGPGRTCIGAVPCRCDQSTEGDGCDIPGHCEDDQAGCCDSDWECPVGKVCSPGNTCEPAPVPGRCWTDSDCYTMGQTCEGVSVCGCGLDCLVPSSPGRCLPLPTHCCNGDDDCNDGTECRFRDPSGHMPGRCVADHLGPACAGDQACCWEDGDCPGGYCQDAYGCGCIDLCPVCGACAADQMGFCKSWAIQVQLTSSVGECLTSGAHPAFQTWRIPLGWHTSLPAKSQIELALNAFPGNGGYIPIEEGFVQDHAFDLSVGHMHFARPPRAGEEIRIRVRVTGEQGEKGLSEEAQFYVDAQMAACMYPYDPTCSDGTPIVCRALPPPCDADKVMAAYQGCQHCVYAATCNCDDGEPVECAAVPPTCDDGLVLAAQDGCWACVHPLTCSPDSPW